MGNAVVKPPDVCSAAVEPLGEMLSPGVPRTGCPLGGGGCEAGCVFACLLGDFRGGGVGGGEWMCLFPAGFTVKPQKWDQQKSAPQCVVVKTGDAVGA